MIIDDIRAEDFNHPSPIHNNISATSLKALHSHSPANIFLANILSKAFVSLYADFYSPLKNPSLT